MKIIHSTPYATSPVTADASAANDVGEMIAYQKFEQLIKSHIFTGLCYDLAFAAARAENPKLYGKCKGMYEENDKPAESVQTYKPTPPPVKKTEKPMSAQSEWKSAIAQAKSANSKLSHAQAVALVAKEQPQLRERLVAEVNAGRKTR